MQESVFFIEANSFETHALWKEHHQRDLIWEQDPLGFSQVIGYINDDEEKPVRATFTFATIFGSRICFYDVCSRFSDAQMVEGWIEANYPLKWDEGRRRAMTDAQNFHHVIEHCIALASVRNSVTNSGK